MTMTNKHRQLLVIVLIVALLAGMFVPMSPAYASTESGEEELILEGGSGEITLTGDELPENSQLLFATSVMSVDTSVQLDTQSKIYYDNWFTSRYRVKVNGEWKVAYCVQPDLLAPPDGSYNPAYGENVEYDVAKGLYYSYGYPGWTKTTKPVVKKLLSQYGDKDWNLNSSDDCYSLCHVLLSYYYDDVSANSADAFLGVDADTRNIIRALAKQIKEDTETFPDVPRTAEACEVSFTADGKTGDAITVELDKADWNSSKAIQTTPTIKLKGYRDNSVNLTVPDGATMYMTVDGTTEKYSAGTTVEVFVGDPFYFTAPETKTGTWSSGTLKANIAEFTAYMIKVSGRQNMAFAGVDNADTTSLKIDWIDEGEGKLIKVTENPSITKNNAYYSLANGEFKVYKDDGTLYKTLTTDANGIATMEGVPYGTYTVREVKAPTGHALNETAQKIVIDSPRLVEFSFSDLAQSDTISIVLYKADNETKLVSNLGMIPQHGATLEGAEFEIKFYGKNNNTPKALVPEDNTVLAQWKVRTDARGEAKLAEEYLVEGYDNSKFYKNSKGEICLPLGVVTIQETKAPEGYLLNDKVYTKYITAEGTTETVKTFAEPTVYNQIKRGDFEFIKVSDGTMKRLSKVQNWAKTEKKEEMESALAFLYQSDDDETAFNLIVEAFGGNFDMISFFFFAKDMNNYLPLRSKRFDERFEKLGIKSALSGNCTWVNYIQYISWIREVQDFLVSNLNEETTLLDAHSFLWILPFIDKYIAAEMQIAEHNKFGKGVVTDIDDEYIVIRFGKTERKFQQSAIGSIIQLMPLENGIYEDDVVEENKYESHEYAIINAPRIASVTEWEKILRNELKRNSGFDFVNNVLVEMYKLENYTIFCKGFEKEHGHKGLNLRVGEFRDRIKNIDEVELEEQIRDDTHTDRAWNIPFETDIELNQEEKNIGKFSWKLRSELIQAMENVLPDIKRYRNSFTAKPSDKLPESLIDKKVTYIDAKEYFVNPPTPKVDTGGNKKKYPPKKDYVMQQKRNKLVGDLGEEKVKADEIYSLKLAGRGDLASKVTIVTSDAFGYDVVSFNENGMPKHIEVKTSTSASEEIVFQITDNEVRTILEDPYCELHYLFNINGDEIKKVIFDNRDLRENIIRNYLRPTHYEVKLKK